MRKPFGVLVVFGSETLLSLITGLLGLMYVVYGFYGMLHKDWARMENSLGIAVVLLVVGAACYYAGCAVLEGLRWGWRASLAIGLFIVGCAVFLMLTNKGEGWGVGIGLLILVTSLPAWAALLLPSTIAFCGGCRDQASV